MWFDPDEAQREFDRSLFGYNPWAFAYHADPEGFRALSRMRGPRLADYERLVPNTCAAARALFRHVRQRRRWGKQLSTGRWATETFGEWVPAGAGRSRPAEMLGFREVLKHLTGRAGYARGTTDVPNRHYEHDATRNVWRANLVDALRIDVDQDNPWAYENEHPIIAELRSERRIAEAVGLGYSVFKTGSRGVQAVIPLPEATPHSLASLVLQALLIAWERRGRGFAAADKTNLVGLMRLPGGVHATTGNLGLWIDPEAGELYDIERQARLMGVAFEHPQDALLDAAVYGREGRALVRAMCGVGLERTTVLSREQAERVMEANDGNAVVVALRRGIAEGERIAQEREAERQAWRRELHGEQAQETTDAATTTEGGDGPEAERVAAEVLETAQEVGEIDPYAAAPMGTPEWAKRVWLEGYGPGGHWEWISMGGKRGILAATILFGESGAEAALIELARKVPALTESARQERVHTVHLLWRGFGWKGYQAWEPSRPKSLKLIDGAADAEVEEIAAMIVSGMLERQPKPRWRKALAERVALTLLIGVRDSDGGRLVASFGTVAESINARWPEEGTNRERVAQMVPRMCSGRDGLFPAFRRIGGRRWAGEPDEYQCGRGLRGTAFAARMAQRAAERALSEFDEEEDGEIAVENDPGPLSDSLGLDWTL